MFGLDENATKDVKLDGVDVTWKVGSIPLGKAKALRVEWAALLQPLVRELPPDASVEQRAAQGLARIPYAEKCAEIVRWGLRGWTIPGLDVELVEESFAGKPCKVLSPRLAEYLARVGGGSLVEALALPILQAQDVSEADLLGFK